MWSQWWIVDAPDEATAVDRVRTSLGRWSPQEASTPSTGSVRFYVGTDDLALSEAFVTELQEIHQEVARSHRQEIAARFWTLAQRPLGIPPRAGWVMLDHETPRSPRPIDWSRGHGPRWIVTVDWPGDPPVLGS